MTDHCTCPYTFLQSYKIIRKSFVKENGSVDWTQDKLGLDEEVLENFSSLDDIFVDLLHQFLSLSQESCTCEIASFIA